MVQSNLVPNHQELMFACVLHPLNIERLAIPYFEHISTLDFSNTKSDDEMTKILNLAIDFLPITSIEERRKWFTLYKRDFSMFEEFISPLTAPMSPEVIENICVYDVKHAVTYLSFQLRELIEELQKPTMRIRYKHSHHPAYGHPGTPGFINIIHPLFRKEPHLENLIIDLTCTHEKGHGLRFFVGNSDVSKKLQDCFDAKEIHVSKINREYILSNYRLQYNEKWKIKKELSSFYKQGLYEYYFSAHEILERMAQLKNYFGFSNPDDEFTLSHLNFARDNYVRDFFFFGEIQMYPFLSAITKKTENRFVQLMNEFPI